MTTQQVKQQDTDTTTTNLLLLQQQTQQTTIPVPPFNNQTTTTTNNNNPNQEPVLTEEMKELKRRERLEQNRLSARESRKRKKTMIEELQRSVINLSRENKELQQRNELIKRQLLDLGSKFPNAVPLHLLSTTTGGDGGGGGGQYEQQMAQQQQQPVVPTVNTAQPVGAAPSSFPNFMTKLEENCFTNCNLRYLIFVCVFVYRFMGVYI